MYIPTAAMIANIEKAFLNIATSPEHREYLSFSWVYDVRSKRPNILTVRFLTTLLLNIPPLALMHDDLASGSDSVESALTLAKRIKTRLLEGGLNMRNG